MKILKIQTFAIFITTLLFFENALSKEVFILNENSLLETIDDSVPEIERINSAVMQSILNSSSNKEVYDTRMNLSTSYNGTNEKVNAGSNPVVDNMRNYQVDVEQNLPYGISFGTGVRYSYQKNTYDPSYAYLPQQNQTVYKSHTPSTFANLSIDLWKNFLGYSDTARIDSLELNKKEALVQADIKKNQFSVSMRKIYWDMVMNKMTIDVYNGLIKKSEEQKENTIKMYNSSVADKGDVAKAQASLSSRKSELVGLEYVQDLYIKNLKQFIPSLTEKDVKLDDVDSEKTTNKILNCIYVIKSKQEIPYEYTKYDEFIAYTDKQIQKDLKSARRYSDADVKLNGGVNIRGYDDANYTNAYDDLYTGNKTDYSVGLNISIPFGKSTKQSEESKIKLYKMMHNYNKKEVLSNISSLREYFNNASERLLNSLEEAKSYRKNNDISLEAMKKKYYQGRVPLSQVIQYEDDLLRSELSIISIQKQIIDFVLDYISVFGDVPCDFNPKLGIE